MIKRSDISTLERETRKNRLNERRTNLLLTGFDQLREVVGHITENELMEAEQCRVIFQTGTREAFEKNSRK